MDRLSTRSDVLTKSMKGIIEQTHLSFYNRRTGQIQPNIWTELSSGLWRTFNIDNFLYNEHLGPRRLTEHDSLFEGFEIIYPGCYWDFKSNKLKEEGYLPRFRENASRATLMQTLEEYFSLFEGKRIGVHLSGGLDSSLIMAWLRALGIPFVAVGMASSRWEFRTERRIQDLVGAWAEDMCLIDMEEGYMASEDYFLAEQYPDATINTSQTTITTIKAFKERGVEVVFTGQGGDSLLVNAVPKRRLDSHFLWGAMQNIENEFINSSEVDYYRHHGLELVSPFANNAIIDQLSNLRIGEPEDIKKKWARHFFADILPKELSQYSYVADFMGHYVKRLEELRGQMPMLMREARELLPHKVFSEVSIKNMLDYSLLNLETASYFKFTAPLRIAIWLRGLRQAGIIQE